jgi:hypothetical protein
VINALGNIAAYIPAGRDHSVLYDFISKMLEMYVNIGLEAKKLSDKVPNLRTSISAEKCSDQFSSKNYDLKITNRKIRKNS